MNSGVGHINAFNEWSRTLSPKDHGSVKANQDRGRICIHHSVWTDEEVLIETLMHQPETIFFDKEVCRKRNIKDAG